MSKSPYEGIVKSIRADTKDDKHFYDFVAQKKMYRYKAIMENGDEVIFRKMVEHGPNPFEPGDKIKGQIEEKEAKNGRIDKIITGAAKIDASGNVVSTGGSKSTWNDPAVFVPKMYMECLRRAKNVLTFLTERTLSDPKMKEKDPFHIFDIQDTTIFKLGKELFGFISNCGEDLNRDHMELRMAAFDIAFGCMQLPTYTHLQGNDEEQDKEKGIIVKKRLIVKLIEQANEFHQQAVSFNAKF